MTSATEFEYGPIDVYVVEFEGTGVDSAVLDALLELSASGTVRLVDLVVASRDHDGAVVVTELSEEPSNAMTVFDVDLEAEGLIGDEDIAEAMESVAPGFGIAIAAIEMTWANKLATRLSEARGRVVRTERIPAPAVNALVAAALTNTSEGA